MKKSDKAPCDDAKKVLQKAHNADWYERHGVEKSLGTPRPQATFPEIGRELGISAARAHQIFVIAMHKLLLDAEQDGANVAEHIAAIPQSMRCGTGAYAAHRRRMTDEQKAMRLDIFKALRP